MKFGFTKTKTVTSISVFAILEILFIFSFFVSTISCLCEPNVVFEGKDYYDYLPFPLTVCHCGSIPLSTVIGQYIALAFPLLLGAFIYLIWSLVQKGSNP